MPVWRERIWFVPAIDSFFQQIGEAAGAASDGADAGGPLGRTRAAIAIAVLLLTQLVLFALQSV